jgi:hypothetical protein
MNYIDVVNLIKTIVSQHVFINDVGYGEISDIKHRSEQTITASADYPYLFINPTFHSRRPNEMIYRFNLIVMDMVDIKTDDFLLKQSQCQQYIDDIISELYTNYRLTINDISYTPFKERFQDDVAGMTATLSISILKPLNNCIVPIIPPFIWNLNRNNWNNEVRIFNDER